MRNFILPLALLLLFFSFVGCCSRPTTEPEPVDNFARLVEERVEQWLDPRMDDPSWLTFHGQQDTWSNSPSLAALADWFHVELGIPSGIPAFWDFASFVQELKDSNLYSRGPPTDAELLHLLVEELKKYHYGECSGDCDECEEE